MVIIPPDILTAMITPAVLISATGTLVFSTANRLVRVVDRIRALAAEAEQLRPGAAAADETARAARRALILDQLPRLSRRLMLLRSSLTSLYLGLGLFVATSIAIAAVAIFHPGLAVVPLGFGLLGTLALLHSTALLLREARLAVQSNLHEVQAIEAATRAALALPRV